MMAPAHLTAKTVLKESEVLLRIEVGFAIAQKTSGIWSAGHSIAVFGTLKDGSTGRSG